MEAGGGWAMAVGVHELKPSTMINRTEWHQAGFLVLLPFSFCLLSASCHSEMAFILCLM